MLWIWFSTSGRCQQQSRCKSGLSKRLVKLRQKTIRKNEEMSSLACASLNGHPSCHGFRKFKSKSFQGVSSCPPNTDATEAWPPFRAASCQLLLGAKLKLSVGDHNIGAHVEVCLPAEKFRGFLCHTTTKKQDILKTIICCTIFLVGLVHETRWL